MTESNAFASAVDTRRRPGFSVEPRSMSWDAVAFSVRGSRDAVACVPRRSLASFLADLDDGRLDEAIESFLASEPSGRVLRAAGQTGRPGLFDSISAPDAIVASERVPGRVGVLSGAGGGTPLDARQNKDRHGPRRPRRVPTPKTLLVAAAAVATVGLGAVAVESQDDPVRVVQQQAQQQQTGTTPAPDGLCHVGLCGTWDAVAEANIGTFPQTVNITAHDLSTGAFSGDVNGSFVVEGTLTGSTMIWNYSGGGYRADFETTFAGEGVGATFEGTFTDNNGSSGTFSATRTQA